MADALLKVEGLTEFRKALRGIGGPEWARMLTKANKVVAVKAQGKAQGAAQGLGGLQAKAASSIKAYATGTKASIGPLAGSAAPYANVAFYGVRRHLGWYGDPKYDDSGPQHLPPWVGSGWEPAVAGQGPYAINAALTAYVPEMLDDYMAAIDEMVRPAFPD